MFDFFPPRDAHRLLAVLHLPLLCEARQERGPRGCELGKSIKTGAAWRIWARFQKLAKKPYVARAERRSIGRFAEASTISGAAMTTSYARIAITVAWTKLDHAAKAMRPRCAEGFAQPATREFRG